MMRLAFAVAVHTDPDIFCWWMSFLSGRRPGFSGEVPESHCRYEATRLRHCFGIPRCEPGWKGLCDRALWLKQGTVVAYGEPNIVTGQYTMEMRSQTQQRTPYRPPELAASGTALKTNENRFRLSRSGDCSSKTATPGLATDWGASPYRN